MKLEEMKPHQLRVVAELEELSDKRKRLILFIESSPSYASLHAEEQTRLRSQCFVMGQYEDILQDRIAHFS